MTVAELAQITNCSFGALEENLDGRFGNLEKNLDKRFQAVDGRLQNLDERLAVLDCNMQAEFEVVRHEWKFGLREFEAHLLDTIREVGIPRSAFAALSNAVKDLSVRVGTLEKKA